MDENRDVIMNDFQESNLVKDGYKNNQNNYLIQETNKD